MATILLAEKNAHLRGLYREAITRYLAGGPHKILEAWDGEEALKLAHAQHLDALITELELPHLAGADLVRNVREIVAGGGSTVVLVVSGWIYPKDEAESTAAGADEFVKKPCNLHALCGTLDRLLTEARKRLS